MNLGNTFNEEDFDAMIYTAIKEREMHIIQKNKIEIICDQKISLALQNSQFISSNNLNLLTLSSYERSLSITFKKKY